MKSVSVIALLISCVMISSCATAWTFNFLPVEEYQQTDLKGWVFEPDIEQEFSLKKGADSLIGKYQNFMVDFRFEIPKNKNHNRMYDIGVEGVSIRYFGTDTEKALFVDGSYVQSWGSEKNVRKLLSLLPKNPTLKTTVGKKSLYIPLSVDSALLMFDAVLTAGRYTTTPRGDSKYTDDTIIVFDDAEPIKVPVAMVLHRKTDKISYPAISQGH